MRFANPAMLWLLLVIPPAVGVFLWWSARHRRELMTRFIESRLLPGLTVGVSPARRRLRALFLIIAVSCLIVALARPQWGFDWQEAHLRGLDIVVGIDTSRSMLAEDIAPNRLARAKLAALDLVQLARSDRLGLVAFAGTAFLQCPLTIDDNAFRQSLDSLNTSIIPQGGTAIAEAIRVAETAFKEGDNHRVLVLLTDGEDHDSGALEAAKKAAAAGLRIYTVGVGTPEGELIRLKQPDGRTDYVRDEQGNVVKSHMNEELLRQIAGATEGGFYLPLRGAKTMETLFEQGLAKLPKSDHQEKLIKRYHERFHWPLAAAILMFALEAVFPERPRRRRGSRPALKAAAALLAMAALLPSPAFGSASRALRDYKEGNFPDAKREYDQMLKKKPDDARLHFNAGAAAYRDRQFDEAAKHFGKALTGPDLNLQEMGYYNRGNAQYYLGEQAPDPAQQKELWKKALQDFESSIKLNPKDSDAEHNRDLVRRRLEELQQQQQQQQNQQQKSSDQDDQNQNSQSQQNSQQQQSQDQQQQQQQAEQQQQQAEQQQSQQQQQQQDQSSQEQQQAAQQEDKEKKAAQAKQEEDQSEKQAQPSGTEQAGQEQQGTNAPAAPGEMTQQEARRLLDQQKDNEQMLPPNPTGKPSDVAKPKRDW